MSQSARLRHAPAAEPPGPRGWPGVGVGPAFRTDRLGFLTRMQRRYGEAVRLSLGGARCIILFSDPEAIEQLLVTQAAKYRSREINHSAMEFLGDGLLNIDGELHRRDRAVIQPAFSRRQVESYAGIMLEQAEALLAGWRAGAVVSMHAEMQLLTLGIAARAFFDIDLRHESAALGQAFSTVISYRPLTSLGIPRPRWDMPFTAYGRMRRARTALDAAIYPRLAERRARPVPGDIISDLLAAGMEDRQVRDHALTLLAAGHETTANALAFTFYLLGTNPDARRRVLEELSAEIGDRSPELADLPRLSFLDRVTRESLRLYPPAWTIGRRAAVDDVIGGYALPAGRFVMASQWVVHRLPRHWPEPLRFHPDRWLPVAEGGQAITTFSYFPFGGGHRTCIGMPFAQQELKLLLAAILQRFVPELVPGQRLVLEPHVTLRPVRGTDMRLLPR